MATVQQDFIELNRIKNRCLEILPVTSAFAVLTLTTYLGLRLKTTLEAFQATNDSRSLLSSLLYLVVEAGFFLPNFLNHILRCLAQPPGTISHLRLSNDTDHPAVDIFITCCGEDVDTITNTVEAACALDYPTSCFRVIVLDDAASEELLKRIESIKKYRPNLFYTARSKDDHQDFKAGNLNHGFKYVETLAGGPAPFIAALDTDMIPDPKWLLALLPHLLRDDGEIALVQPPQRFYDVPSPDPLLQGLEVNYRVTEPLRETMGSTWCGGSGYVVRRTALDSIGGFPTGSVGEDMYCSNILLGKGWKTRYVDESLQYGRVPESYTAHTKQQSRWHVGRIQTAIAMGFYLFGAKARAMSFKQRAAGLIAVCLSLANITTTVALILLPVVMLLRRPLIAASHQNSLRTLLLMANASIISEWLDDCGVALITGYRTAMSEGHDHAAAIIDAFLPCWLRPKTFQFSASGCGSSFNERDEKGRPPLSQRLVDILWKNKAVFHVFYIIFLSMGVASTIFQQSGQNIEAWSKTLLVTLGWPPLLWLICLNSMAIPVLYAFFPPTIPNRDQLLKLDPQLRASYPCKQEGSKSHSFYLGEDVCYSMCVLYTFLVTGLMWFL
ncbi:MAG: hypothetical protein L6R39_001800 [Caloplaca ligustica]|nr:MAG: hypothetical protein L6R39_001800 [Caloplaca ligustica]